MQRALSVLSLGFFALIGLSLAATSQAGDKKKDEGGGPPKVKHGPEHKFLQSLVGSYDAKVKMFTEPGKDPVEGKGTLTRKMILEGNYLHESFQGEFFGQPFKGMGIIGFDNNTKRYTNVWFDTMSTSMSQMHGFYDADKKVLIMLGDDIDPTTKKKVKNRDMLRITGSDTQTFEMFRLHEGATAETKVMEITYTRNGGDKKAESKDEKK